MIGATAALIISLAGADIVRDPDGKIHRSSSVLRQFQHINPCPVTGSRSGSCPNMVKDHIVPLCAGGRDAISNLKWSEIGYAKLRDVQEVALCNTLKELQGSVKLDTPVTLLCDIIKTERLTLLETDICPAVPKPLN